MQSEVPSSSSSSSSNVDDIMKKGIKGSNTDSDNNRVIRYCYWIDKGMYIINVLLMMVVGFMYMLIAVPSVVNVISHTLIVSLISLTVCDDKYDNTCDDGNNDVYDTI